MHTAAPPNAMVFVDPLSSLLLCVPQSRKVNDSDPEIACLFGGFDLHANLRNFLTIHPAVKMAAELRAPLLTIAANAR